MRGWVLLLTIVLAFSGCLSQDKAVRQFVCWDGSVVTEPNLCPVETTTSTLPQEPVKLQFTQGRSSCGVGSEPSFTTQGENLFFKGGVGTPSPCYNLEAKLVENDSVISIVILANSKGGVCVKCVGDVKYSGMISGLTDGTYNLRLLYGARNVLDEDVTLVSRASDLYFLCGTIAGLNCPPGMMCEFEREDIADAGGRCVKIAKSTTIIMGKGSIGDSTSTSTIPSTTLLVTTTLKASTTTTPASQHQIIISEVQFDAPDDDRKKENLNGEWVDIRNTGTQAQELTAWTLTDEAGHTYRFPTAFTLEVGESVRIHSGSGEDTGHDLYWGSGRAIWNNDGDTATLKDATGSIIYLKKS